MASLLTKAPEKEIVDEFEKAKAGLADEPCAEVTESFRISVKQKFP
ncbi:MAG: hypothetical protein IJY22_05580 [Clostridia bacterium]|nr:hypothetical protein [Clostridia bacterium]